MKNQNRQKIFFLIQVEVKMLSLRLLNQVICSTWSHKMQQLNQLHQQACSQVLQFHRINQINLPQFNNFNQFLCYHNLNLNLRLIYSVLNLLHLANPHKILPSPPHLALANHKLRTPLASWVNNQIKLNLLLIHLLLNHQCLRNSLLKRSKSMSLAKVDSMQMMHGQREQASLILGIQVARNKATKNNLPKIKQSLSTLRLMHLFSQVSHQWQI